MTIELYNYIRHALGDKSTVVVKISEVEKLGGEDWLLEIAAQAEQLKVQITPHPKDRSLIVIEREGA